MAVVALVAASCSNESDVQVVENTIENNALAPVTVRVADFSISQEEFPDAQGTRGATRAAEPHHVALRCLL